MISIRLCYPYRIHEEPLLVKIRPIKIISWQKMMQRPAAAAATAASSLFMAICPNIRGLILSLLFSILLCIWDCVKKGRRLAPRRQHPNNFRFFCIVGSKVLGLLVDLSFVFLQPILRYRMGAFGSNALWNWLFTLYIF